MRRVAVAREDVGFESSPSWVYVTSNKDAFFRCRQVVRYSPGRVWRVGGLAFLRGVEYAVDPVCHTFYRFVQQSRRMLPRLSHAHRLSHSGFSSSK